MGVVTLWSLRTKLSRLCSNWVSGQQLAVVPNDLRLDDAQMHCVPHPMTCIWAMQDNEMMVSCSVIHTRDVVIGHLVFSVFPLWSRIWNCKLFSLLLLGFNKVSQWNHYSTFIKLFNLLHLLRKSCFLGYLVA